MRAAGVRRFGDPVEILDLPGPGPLRPDEVLIDVRAAGVGNWDEFARTGSWDLGARPPMALGVEAALLVTAVRAQVSAVRSFDRVCAHSAPLRAPCACAQQHVAAAGHVALSPAFVRSTSLPRCRSRRSPPTRRSVTRSRSSSWRPSSCTAPARHLWMLVQLVAHRGATVIATARPDSAYRVSALWVATVLDYHQPDWPKQVRALTQAASTRPPTPCQPGPAR